MNFPDRGFYRGDVSKLFADATRIFNSLPPEEQVRMSAELHPQESLVEGADAAASEGNDPPRADSHPTRGGE